MKSLSDYLVCADEREAVPETDDGVPIDTSTPLKRYHHRAIGISLLYSSPMPEWSLLNRGQNKSGRGGASGKGSHRMGNSPSVEAGSVVPE